MSQQNSDPLFDSVEFGTPVNMPGAQIPTAPPPTTGGRTSAPTHGFTIYTVMLILSFVFLATASILLFVDSGKY